MEPDSGHRPDHRDHRWTPAAGHTNRLPLDRVVADASEHLVVMAALAHAAGDILDAATIQLRDGVRDRARQREHAGQPDATGPTGWANALLLRVPRPRPVREDEQLIVTGAVGMQEPAQASVPGAKA